MIQTFSLPGGITLDCFQDSRFKQSCLSLQFITPMQKNTAALNALLPAVLLRGTENAPDLRDITLRLDDLYGASVGSLVRRIGDYQTTGFYCGFISDKYALDKDQVFSPMVDFLRELLLQPLLENGVFPVSFVESEKRNLISAIESQRNDKRTYASARLLQLTCKDDSFGIPRTGDIESVSAITPEGLFSHYRSLLKKSPVRLFYVGDTCPEQVAKMLAPLFSDLDRQVEALPAQTAFSGGAPETHKEEAEVSQARLSLAYTTPITLRSPSFAAMQVLNVLFGSGMTCKLFTQIRERMSLCYEIGSVFHSSKGIVEVYAGVDKSNLELVQAETQKLLDACKQGDFTGEELENAKQALLSSLRSTHDSPGSIERYYATGALSGLNMTPEEYMENISAVTPKQVAAAAETLRLQTVYFLKGAD